MKRKVFVFVILFIFLVILGIMGYAVSSRFQTSSPPHSKVYHYLSTKFDPLTNSSSTSLSYSPLKLTREDYHIHTSADGMTVTTADVFSDEYECYGKCECKTSQRSTALGQSLYFVVPAVTMMLAAAASKQYFEQSCKLSLRDICEEDDIDAVTEGCMKMAINQNAHLTFEERVEELMAKEPMLVKKMGEFMCEGGCEYFFKEVDFPVHLDPDNEVDCENQQLVMPLYAVDEIWARTKFRYRYLVQHCEGQKIVPDPVNVGKTDLRRLMIPVCDENGDTVECKLTKWIPINDYLEYY